MYLQELHWAVAKQGQLLPVFYTISPKHKSRAKDIAAAWLESQGVLELSSAKTQVFANIDYLFGVTGHRVSTSDRYMSHCKLCLLAQELCMLDIC